MSRNIVKTMTFLIFSMTHKPKHCKNNDFPDFLYENYWKHCKSIDFLDFSWFGNLLGQSPPGHNKFGKYEKSRRSLLLHCFSIIFIKKVRKVIVFTRFRLMCRRTSQESHCFYNVSAHRPWANERKCYKEQWLYWPCMLSKSIRPRASNDFFYFSWFGNLSGQAPPEPDGFGKHAKSIKSLFFRAFAFVCSWTMSRHIVKTMTLFTFRITHKPNHCKNNDFLYFVDGKWSETL